jgi:hypothetical protein
LIDADELLIAAKNVLGTVFMAEEWLFGKDAASQAGSLPCEAAGRPEVTVRTRNCAASALPNRPYRPA